MSNTFECEIQARLRDVNLGGHVDNVEAIRILDEARILFLRFADLAVGGPAGARGLLAGVPEGVAELVGSQRVDYRAEMRFVPFQPFLLRLWVSRVGRSSFAVDSELRVTADGAPAIVASTTAVLFDVTTQTSWPMTEEVTAALEAYAGTPVSLRG